MANETKIIVYVDKVTKKPIGVEPLVGNPPAGAVERLPGKFFTIVETLPPTARPLPAKAPEPVEDEDEDDTGDEVLVKGKSQYIYLQGGVEIRREDKSRGKTKKEAFHKDGCPDWEWYIDLDKTPMNAEPHLPREKKEKPEKLQPVYIYLDHDGNETRRENKGKGRTNKHAFQKVEGSHEWFINNDGYVPPLASTKASQPKTTDGTPGNQEEEDNSSEVIPEVSVKHVRTAGRTTIAALCECLFVSSNDVYREREGRFITLNKVVVVGVTGLPDDIKKNDVYNQIVLDADAQTITTKICGRVSIYDGALIG